MKASTRLLDSTEDGSSQGVPEQLLVQLPTQPEPGIKVKPTSRDYSNSTNLMLIGLSICVLVFFSIRRLQKQKHTKIQHQLESPRFKRHISCSKCRFFNKNPYLRCAVHPQSVNKIDAKDCPDFWPGDRDKFHEKQDV